MSSAAPNIIGADTLIEWFGRWPSFHDAEVLTFHIDREHGKSFIRLRAFTIGDRIDEGGRFVKQREATVAFELSGIRSIRIDGEDADVQNVISSLTIEQIVDGYRMVLGPCYGIGGELVVKGLSVRLE